MATPPIEGRPRIVPMLPEHAGQVLAIYQAGIDEGDATFETTAPTWQTFDTGKLPEHRLVALDDTSGRVLGWAAVAPASRRPAYAGVVEHSVYVHPAARGRGVGLALLIALIASTEAAGIWTLRSGIFPENTASPPSTSAPGSASSAPATAPAACTADGGTSSSSNAAAPASPDQSRGSHPPGVVAVSLWRRIR